MQSCSGWDVGKGVAAASTAVGNGASVGRTSVVGVGFVLVVGDAVGSGADVADVWFAGAAGVDVPQAVISRTKEMENTIIFFIDDPLISDLFKII